MIGKFGTHFGIHLTYDAYNCPIETLNNQDLIYKFLNSMTSSLKMRKLSDALVYKAEANNFKDPGGYSGFVIIAESHISVHTFDKRGFVSADVYSCKDFDSDMAVDLLNSFFKPGQVEVNMVIRGKKYPKKDIYK